MTYDTRKRLVCEGEDLPTSEMLALVQEQVRSLCQPAGVRSGGLGG